MTEGKAKRKNWVLKSKPERKAKSEKPHDEGRDAAREIRKRRSPLYNLKD